MRQIVMLIMATVLSVSHLWAQQRTITGKVTDETGNALANASIQVKGANTGTTSGPDGFYSLIVPSPAKALVFTYINMEESEVILGDQSVINVTLKKIDQALEEVVVAAYGVVKKEAFTGSVGAIKAKEIEKRLLGNVFRSIEGAIPGVVTTSGSGQPGNSIAIRIRGFGSFSATQEPLLVVDGIPYVGGTSNINPDDVESMSILKDASATALYGSRAGNGFIMITTKKGRKGRNNISVKISQGISERGLPEYERVNEMDYYPVMWEAYRNSLVYRTSGAISLDSANRVASGLTSRNGISDLLAYNP